MVVKTKSLGGDGGVWGVGGVCVCVCVCGKGGLTVALGPDNEEMLPRVVEPGPHRPVERRAVPLHAVDPMVAVDAEAAPVVVGGIAVGGELEQDLARGSGGRGAHDEGEDALGGALPAVREGAAAVLDRQRDLVEAAAPALRHGEAVGRGPAAAVGGCRLGDGMQRAAELALAEDLLALHADPLHLRARPTS